LTLNFKNLAYRYLGRVTPIIYAVAFMKNFLFYVILFCLIACNSEANKYDYKEFEVKSISEPYVSQNYNIDAQNTTNFNEIKKIKEPDEPQLTYQVYIDNSFSKEEKQTIIKAFNNWQKATTNIVSFELQYTGEELYCEYCINVIAKNLKFVQSRQTPEAVAITRFFSAKENTAIYIAMDYIRLNLSEDKRLFMRVMIHEVGHTIGLNHDRNGTVMADRIDASSNKITCRDLQKLFSKRDLKGNSKELCLKL